MAVPQRTSLLAQAQEEILGVSAWFTPGPGPAQRSVVVRFSGHRTDGTGHHGSGDRFEQDETVTVLDGAGSVCVTARVHGLSPGAWAVEARVLDPAAAGRPRTAATEARLASWSWRRWSLRDAGDGPVHTCLTPFVRVPGVLLGGWAVMVALGFLGAIAVLALVSARVAATSAFVPVTVISLVSGAVGAKVWFLVLHHREHRAEGWCVQGFVAGALAAVLAAALLRHIDAARFLDAATPALFLGLAIGRVGCLLGGCCYGRATASRWGLWSSDRHLGVRRIPTQLMEASLGLVLAVASMAVVLGLGTAHGGVLAAALGIYVVVRQGILRLRAEPRQSTYGVRLSAAAAAATVLADVAVHATTLLRFPAGG